jgi:hypothetical protein
MEKNILVKNPLTGRWIKKNGSTFNKLIDKKIKINCKSVKKKTPFKPKSYKVTKSFKSFPIDNTNISWSKKKPNSKGEREYIYKKCGESCFLIPQQLKFPICNKNLPCTYNCRGLKAASSRAGEWKYDKVLKTSKDLTDKFGCYKVKK